MAIRYALFENALTSDPDDYKAQVQITGSADFDLIAQRMVERGNTVTKPDLLAVFETMQVVCESLVLEGYRVNLGGLVELFPKIGGTFQGAGDGYDAARHRVDVAAAPGARLRGNVRAGATVEKVTGVKPSPIALSFSDLATGETNDSATPANIGTVRGSKLKYDPASPDEGVYFVPVGGGAEVKVSAVQKNKPSELVFLIPALAPGGYTLQVRARMAGGSELRVGRLDATLTV